MAKKAGMATGVEVARISVKVSPDTTGFYGELKRKLEAVEKALGKDGIDVGEAEVGTEKAEKKVAASTKRMSKNKVKIKAEVQKVDLGSVAKDLSRNISALDRFAGGFDMKNGLLWDPKEAKEATQVAMDNYKAQQDAVEKLAQAEAKRLKDLEDKSKKIDEANKRLWASDAKATVAAVLGGKSQNNDLRWKLNESVDEMNRLVAASKEADEATDRLFASADKKTLRAALKPYIDGVKELDGSSKKSKGRGRGGINVGIGGGGGGGGFNPSSLLPSFGSGINPAGYALIMGGLILVAAPLIGLVSTLVLAIPGMISAIATPMMAIGLGMEGIKKAAANSGLFKYDEEGKLEGLGAVFDKVKAETSAAFEQGLTPALKSLASAIDPLLSSLPKVATGLSDMFQGFVDSITSETGTALFDDTIKNIGAAMSAAQPGIKAFTDGFLVLANSFTQQLPGMANWLNRTGESFSKWMTKMTTVPDPAGHHGPNPNGKTPMDSAFEGLGGTLETIGAWAIDMANAGMKFVSDPNKMKDFIATLDNIGQIITKLTDMGNQMAAVWKSLGLLPERSTQEANAAADRIINPPKPEEAPKVGASDWLHDSPGKGWWDSLKMPDEIKSDIAEVNKEIETLQGNIRQQTLTSPYAEGEDAVLGNLKTRLATAKQDMADLQELLASKGGPQVALKSLETPLSPAEGGKPTVVSQIIDGLKEVPPAAQTAKESLDAIQNPMTPEALGAVSAQAQPVPTPQEPAKIPAPDTSAFDAAVQQLPAAMDESMAAVTASVTTGGANATSAALLVATNIYNAMVANAALFQTVGLQMMAGLATGITAGSSMAIQAAITAATNALNAAKNALEIESPSKKFAELGVWSMKGLAKGMDDGVGPVMDQAKDMADKVALAFSEGTDPTMALKGFNKAEITRMEKALSVQSKELGRQIRALNYRGLKDEAEKARILKDEVDSRKDMLDLANEYNGTKESGSGGEDPFVKGLSGLMNAPADFAKATGKQFMSDLGIGGDGLIGNAITEGISYIFNISSVDEALSIKDREDNKAVSTGLGR